MNEVINILIGCDITYAQFYGVMLTSLFMNNKESKFSIYLLTDETWTEKETKKFEEICIKNDSSLHIKIVNTNILKYFPKTEHISLPAYYRLQASYLLPNDIHKVLYLDGDIIVLGDIRPLWNLNINGYAFAGAEDMDSVTGECFERLGYDSKYGYFNAGVSLYNLDYWRENNLGEKLLDIIMTRPEKIKWMDQDAINMLLHKERFNIPLRYNFQVNHLSTKYWDLYSSDYQKTIEEECQQAVIVHFNSPIKPWTYRYLGYPFFRLWKYYNRKSPWNININIPLKKYIKQCIKRLVCPARVYDERNKHVIKKYWNYK